ncbi:MAG: tocopherol cyclase family protein [Bacillota bacterium]|nr:tocopherol cyclase family protein [Bacillota bacterium]
MHSIIKTWKPEVFQGSIRKKNYFEGWYYKLIDKDKLNTIAVIPGISLGNNRENSHAFVQVADAVANDIQYYKYDMDDFKFSRKRFEVSIKDNCFSNKEISLNLNNKDKTIHGSLEFNSIISFPKTLFNPGIMGPYSFIPFMECYHGIVNVHHEIKGIININNTATDFTGGYGYIEKDWGKSFPESWIWLQSNHFEQGDVSVMFSAARIPWLHKFFTGFISFIRIGDKFYRFATYTGAKVKLIDFNENMFEIHMEDSRHQLDLKAENSAGAVLKAPRNGMMDRDITESISARIHVKFSKADNSIIFEGLGVNTGMEIAGGISELLSNKNNN